MKQTKTANNCLEYRLRSSARFELLPGDQAVLILAYPLKAVYIDRFWKPILNCFTSSGFLPFFQIAKTHPQINALQIEHFLNDLVRKGFLELRGFPYIEDDDLPFVSIIIPVRNRPREISACLSSLEQLDYPDHKTQIIVVDDASDDHTAGTVKTFDKVELIRLSRHSQVSFCRNRAAKTARGEILAFIDSDCIAQPSWLRELVPAFRDESLGAVGGLVASYYTRKYLDQYEIVKSALKIGSRHKRSMEKERFFYVPFCNFLVRRDLFLKLDGLKEDLHVGEDVDFCWRMQDSNAILEYRPVGQIFHKHRNSPWPFCSRRFDYGTSEPILQKRHPGRRKKLFLPPHESGFWIFLLLSLSFQSMVLLILCTGIFVSDAVNRYAKLQQMKLPIGFFTVCQAVIRSYLSFLYHLCSFVSRYYLIPGLLLTPLFPQIGGVIIGMHTAAGIAEYFIKKAGMNPILFFLFFSLEQLSYQSGVFWGCLRHKNTKPVLPVLVHRRDRI